MKKPTFLFFFIFMLALGISISSCNTSKGNEPGLSNYCGQSAVGHKTVAPDNFSGYHYYLIFEKNSFNKNKIVGLTTVEVTEDEYAVYKDGKPIKCK